RHRVGSILAAKCTAGNSTAARREAGGNAVAGAGNLLILSTLAEPSPQYGGDADHDAGQQPEAMCPVRDIDAEELFHHAERTCCEVDQHERDRIRWEIDVR